MINFNSEVKLLTYLQRKKFFTNFFCKFFILSYFCGTYINKKSPIE